MRLYRSLKNPYRPERVAPFRSAGGTDFTDCPAVALRYAQGSRGVVLVVDIDPDQHLATAKLTQEFWFVPDARRFMRERVVSGFRIICTTAGQMPAA